MFDSGIKVVDLINQIRDEADIAIYVKDDVILQSYNGIVIGIYRDIIKHECLEMLPVADGKVEVGCPSESVYRVFTEDFFEAEKVNPTYALITDRVCWFPSKENAIIVKNFPSEGCAVVYHEIPEAVLNLKKLDEDGKVTNEDVDTVVPVPIDFIDMVKAKIRGDMYNISNDDDFAAKWYGVYNTRIEDFKLFVAEKKEEVHG